MRQYARIRQRLIGTLADTDVAGVMVAEWRPKPNLVCRSPLPMNDPLNVTLPAVATSEDRQRMLAESLEWIETHERSFLKAALGAYRIEANRLYQFDSHRDSTGFTSAFEAINARGYGWSQQTFDRYRSAGEVVEILMAHRDEATGQPFARLPEVESQARVLVPLLKLAKSNLTDNWRKVVARVEAGDRLTADLVAEVVTGRTKTQREAERDGKDAEWKEKDGAFATPDWLFEALERQVRRLTGHGFDLDAAANETNHKCEVFYTMQQDSLKQDWTQYGNIWLNPPYHHSVVGKFADKAIETAAAGVTVVCLVPAATADWFYSLKGAGQIQDIRSSVRFKGDGTAVTFGNGMIRPVVAITLGPHVIPGSVGDPIERKDAEPDEAAGDEPIPTLTLAPAFSVVGGGGEGDDNVIDLIEEPEVPSVKATVEVKLCDFRQAVLRDQEIEVRQLKNGRNAFDLQGASKAAILRRLADLHRLDEAPSLSIKFDKV